jgi:multiple sugar transport system permease protein
MPPLTPLRRKEALSAYLFISPFLIWLVFLMGGPILAAFFLSFCSWDLIGDLKFVGLQNFQEMFGFEKLTKIGEMVTSGPATVTSVKTSAGQILNLSTPAVFQEPTSLLVLQDSAHKVMVQSASTFHGFGAFLLQAFDWTLIPNDPRFWSAFYNTAYYTLFSVPIGMVLSILVALLMNQKIKGIEVFRAVYYLPSVLGTGVAMAVLWKWIFNADSGLLNYCLSAVSGIPIAECPKWLASEVWSKPALIIMGFWNVGGGMIIYLAGLQGIPQTHYEAAEIDGANRWQQFLNVTLPGLSPVIFFNLIISLVFSFQIFNQVYVITDGLGGPADSTLVLVLYIYQKAFKYYQYGYASALSCFLFLVIMAATWIQFRYSKWVYYEGELKK